MRFKLFYILLFSAIVTNYAQSSLVKAEIDKKAIRIGEQFEYKLTISTAENVIIPKLDNLKGLEVVDSLKVDTIKNKLVKKYILTGFDSGAFYIPSQQIFIKNQAHITDSLLVSVATIPVDTTKIKKFEIKGIRGEPYQFDDVKKYVYWGIGLLLLVIVTLYFALKRSDKSIFRTTTSELPPYQEALRRLQLLDEKLLWQNNQVKAYYSELTFIVKNYLETALNVRALEQTTNDLVDNLTDLNDADVLDTEKETIVKLRQLFEQSDLVKFAKSEPLAHEIEADRNIATFLINNLKPSIVEENQETSHKQPLIIVQKPEVSQPSKMVKVIIIIVAVLVVLLTSYGITKAVLMSNQVKQSLVANVR